MHAHVVCVIELMASQSSSQRQSGSISTANSSVAVDVNALSSALAVAIQQASSSSPAGPTNSARAENVISTGSQNASSQPSSSSKCA